VAITVETFAEEKWRTGKAFTFYYSNTELDAGATDRIALCVGREPAIIESIAIEGNGEIMSWKVYGGGEVTPGTGTEVREIRRNSNADTTSGVQIEINPTIISDGQAFFDEPIDLIAQVAAGNRAYLKVDLISSLYSMVPMTNYIIDITNNDTGPVKYELSFSIYKD